MKKLYTILEENLHVNISCSVIICLIFLFSTAKIFPGSINNNTTIINVGNAHFEFLTSSLVRMEYSQNKQFINNPTAIIQKREWPAVKVQTTKKNGWLILTTSEINLNYRIDSGPFNTKLLSPVNDTIPGIEVILSTAKPGLLSLDGFAFINDSRTPVWNTETQWIEPRQDSTDIDWYLFIYGRNYQKVLNEYAELSGRIPMIPRYTWSMDHRFEL